MEVKLGYKQTDVGVIPEEWDVIPLAGLCRSICDGTHFTPKYVDNGIPFYSVENVTSDDFVNTKFISAEEHALLIKRCKPERGDILMTRITAGVLGDTRILDWDVNASIYVSLALLKPNDRILPAYLYRYSRSTAFVRGVEKRGLANATPKKINMRDIGAIPIPVPKTEEEQRAIAEALSDADGLLGGMDRLIAKKRDLKQAAMQQLLTGQTRLPGFHGEREVKRLHDVCQKIQDGTHFSPKLGGNDYLYVTSKNIRFGKLDMSTAERISAAEHFKIYARCDVKKGDLLLTKDGANTGNAALNPIDEPFSLLSSVAMLRFDDRLHASAYFMYQILSTYGQRQIKEAMSGNAITRLTLKKIRALRFSVVPLPEQTAIAEVLTEMDAELTALEQRREKTCALKQAMMQELLTGRTRLVPPKEAHV